MRECSICIHPQRLEIERGMLAGVTCRDTAGRWSLSKSAVDRHGWHIARQLDEVERKRGLQAKDLSEKLLRDLQELAERSRSVPRQWLEVVDRYTKQLQLHGKFTGELREQLDVTVTVQPGSDPERLEEKAQEFLTQRGFTVLAPGKEVHAEGNGRLSA